MSEKNISWLRELNFKNVIGVMIGMSIGFGSMYLYFLRETDSEIIRMEKLVQAMIERSSEIDKSTKDIQTKINDFDRQIDAIENSLKSINTSQLEVVREIIDKSASDNNSIEKLMTRLLEVEATIDTMGQKREGTVLTITNPRMGGSNANCPPGTFVSAVSAPRGVGGKYAVDGISQIRVTCTPIQIN